MRHDYYAYDQDWSDDPEPARCRALLHRDDIPQIGRALWRAHVRALAPATGAARRLPRFATGRMDDERQPDDGSDLPF